MKECSKSISRRLSDPNFINRYFVGHGVDIGGKPDPLMLYKSLFCQLSSVKTWDWEDGDAQFLNGVKENEYDFIHSSHCLEHLVDPIEGIKNWLRVIKPGGYLIITVPDEDLYEQGEFPSTFNHDHKWTFCINKARSWSTKSLNVIDLVVGLGETAELVKLEQLSATYRFDLPRFDQTLTPIAECGIEFIIRKRPDSEVLSGGRWERTKTQPESEMLRHLNQYKNDMKNMKSNNISGAPFEDVTPI
jgi:SAM-dependent methyltransferase